MINLVIVKNPFKTDKEIKTVEYIPGKPVYDYIQSDFVGFNVVISLNGEIIPERDYSNIIPKSGDYIAVCPVVEGGGDGKSIGRSLATIALSIATMGVGSLAAGGTFLGAGMAGSASWGFWSWVAATGTYMAGGYLINRMFPNGQTDGSSNREQMHDWSQQPAITTEGNAIPITFGTVKMGVMAPIQTLAQHVTSDGKKQYLNMLLSGGEGPLDSITNLTIDGNSSANYEGLSYKTRMGTNDQSIIQNFNDTLYTKSVNNELVEGASASVNQLDGEYQGLRVTLSFPQGLSDIDESDGDRISQSVTIELKYRLVGNSTWNDWITKTIKGKYDHAIKRIFRKDNIPEGQYEVSAKCTYKRAHENTMDDVYWTSLSGIIYDDFIYPNRALVGIKALATDQLSGSMPKIHWTQSRNNVWVWNPGTNNYEQKPADNPAWGCYDLIHRCRRIKNINTGSFEYKSFGIDAARIDYQEFLDWATYCTNNNLTFNGIIYQTQTLWESFKELEKAGRGRVLIRGTRFSCVSDAPSEPVQLFNVSNMEIDNFKEEFLGTEDRANALELTFFNINNNYNETTIPVYGENYDQETAIENPTQVTLDSAMTLDEAYRYGAYQLRVNQYINRTASWTADIDAITAKAGQVVLVQHDVPQWGEGGRVVSATSNTVTLDQEVTLLSGTDYAVMIRLEDDTLIEKSVEAVASKTTTDTLTVTTDFTTIPAEYDLYSLGEVEKVAKPFRLTSVSREGDFRCRLEAIEYIEEIYEEATNIPQIDYTQSSGEISNVSINQFLKDYNSMLGISWDPPENLYGGARVKIDGDIKEIADAGESSVDCNINYVPVGTEITIKIEAVDIFNNLIDDATAYYTVQSKMTVPSDVNFLDGSFKETIFLKCEDIDEFSFAGYEIRTDLNFGSEDQGLIYKGETPEYELRNPTQRNYKFYLKGYNYEMEYSINYDEITLINSAPSAPNFTGDHITEWFSAIKIAIPEVSDATGYKVYITPSDGAGAATGETTIHQFSAAQDYYYPVNSGDSVLIKIGTYDNLTQLMNDENISAEIEATAASLDNIAQFAADLRPPKIVDALPILPDNNYPNDSSVVYAGKLYINENGEWVSKVQESETAVNALVAGTVEAGAIGADELASAEAIIQKLGANQLIAYEAQIKDAIIDDAKIISVSARKIISEEMIADLMVSRGSITIKGNKKESVESLAVAGLGVQKDNEVAEEWDAWKMSQEGIKGYDSDGIQHVELTNEGRLQLGNFEDNVLGENLPTKNVLIRQSTEPDVNDYDSGDMWVDSDNGNPYLHDGTGWKRTTWQSIKNDENAPADNATENKTFNQPTEPNGIGESEGDVWIDSDNGNPHIYDGANWNRTTWSAIKSDPNAPVDNATPNDFDNYEGTAASGSVKINSAGISVVNGKISITSEDGKTKFVGNSWEVYDEKNNLRVKIGDLS